MLGLSRLFLCIATLLFGTIVVGVLAGYRLNVSASAPVGLYGTFPVPPPLTHGLFVIVPVMGWSRPLMPFLKPIAALGGEWVCQVNHHLLIRGEDFGVVYDTWQGQPLPSAVPLEGCVMVPHGFVFLASLVPQSKDSRYFGPVAIETIQATVHPVWTWEASR